MKKWLILQDRAIRSSKVDHIDIQDDGNRYLAYAKDADGNALGIVESSKYEIDLKDKVEKIINNKEVSYIKKALFATYIIVATAIAATCVLNSATTGVSLHHSGNIYQSHSGFISK